MIKKEKANHHHQIENAKENGKEVHQKEEDMATVMVMAIVIVIAKEKAMALSMETK